MDSFIVRVSKGKDIIQADGSPDMTVGALRQQVESKAGMVDGGLRLLYKGKILNDASTLESAKVISGAKMMAMATAKQREADLQAEKSVKISQDNASLDAMRERSAEGDSASASASASASNASPTNQEVRGDAAKAGQTKVLLKKGRERFRANVELSATIGELKVHAAGLDGMNAAARDMKLLHKGRFLSDDMSLAEAGLRDGSMMMLLFGARYHDKKDAVQDMKELENEIAELEGKFKGVASKARGRLLDSTDLALAKGQVLETYERLIDNLLSIRTEEEAKKSLEHRLRQIQMELERL